VRALVDHLRHRTIHIQNDIFKFEKELKRLGINATIRREQGSDIDAACGQLTCCVNI
jgi:adenine C2-methylase RlmN of 23S rRNA A2503 and tRNA A37